MSYYNYCCSEYSVSVDFGDAGYHDVLTDIDIDIDLEDIANSDGRELLDHIDDDDIEDYVIDNCNEFIPELVDKACDDGMLEVVDAMLAKWFEGGEIDCISDMMTKVKVALDTLTQEQLDFDIKREADGHG